MRESPIFTHAYDLLAWLLGATQKFPRSQRFVLAARIEGAAFDLHAELVRAARDPAQGREALVAADVALDRLRAYLRLAKDLKWLSLDGYAHAARRVAEIGRLLGGWRSKMGGGARGAKDIEPTSGGDDER